MKSGLFPVSRKRGRIRMSRARRIELDNEIEERRRREAGVKVLSRDEFVSRFIRDQRIREKAAELRTIGEEWMVNAEAVAIEEVYKWHTH